MIMHYITMLLYLQVIFEKYNNETFGFFTNEFAKINNKRKKPLQKDFT